MGMMSVTSRGVAAMFRVRADRRPSGALRRRVRDLRPTAEDLEGRTLLSSVGLDPTYGFGGQAPPLVPSNTSAVKYTENISEIALQNGKVVEVGTLTTTPTGGTSTKSLVVSRINANGVVDTTFGTGGRTTLTVIAGGVTYDVTDNDSDILVDSSGNIDILGTATPQAGGNSQFVVAQLSPNGAINTSFGQSGPGFQLISFGSTSSAFAVALASGPGGKLVAVGDIDTAASGTVFGVARLNTNGSLDTAFNTTGTQTVAFNNVVGGAPATNIDFADSVVVQNDGKVVVVGTATLPTGTKLSDAVVARLNLVGQLDNNFNGNGQLAYSYNVGGSAKDEADDVTLQGTGLGTQQIAIAGTSGVGLNNEAITVTRLTSSGSFDTTFNGSGKFQLTLNQQGHIFGTSAFTISTLSDNSLLVGGSAQPQNPANPYQASLLMNLTSTGALNPTFGTNGVALLPGLAGVGSRVFAQSDGKFVYLLGNTVVRTTAPAPAVATTTIVTTGTGKKAKASGVTITFNTGANTTLATNAKVYTIKTMKGNKVIKLKKKNGVVYNAATQTLTFNFASKMAAGKGFRVFIAPGGVIGADGQILNTSPILINPTT